MDHQRQHCCAKYFIGALSPDEGWTPIGLDDFNGDGSIDMFWFNMLNNDTTWLLNANGILQTVSYGTLSAFGMASKDPGN